MALYIAFIMCGVFKDHENYFTHDNLLKTQQYFEIKPYWGVTLQVNCTYSTLQLP